MVKTLFSNIYEFFKNSMLGYWYVFKYASLATYKIASYILYGLFILFYPLIWILKKIDSVIGIFDLLQAFLYLCIISALTLIRVSFACVIFIVKWICIILFYACIGFLLAPFFLLF